MSNDQRRQQRKANQAARAARRHARAVAKAHAPVLDPQRPPPAAAPAELEAMQEAIRMRQGVRRGAAPSGHRRPRCVARPSESSPVPAAPAIDWTSVQRTYGQRFGDAFYARIIYDAEDNVRFFILTFWRPERRDAPVVYATWGAPERELLLVAAVPYFAFEEFVQRAVTHTASAELSPLDVVQCAGLDTPFRTFLVAPPEDGTFSVEEPAGRRRVLRIVPLTPAEQTQAARSPRQTLDQLDLR